MSNLVEEIKNLFITVEGIDGVGKSTISKRLADLVSGVRICTPSERFCGNRESIEKSNKREDKFRFYIDCIIKQQDEISDLLKNSSVVCDRYVHSTFAYQWPLDVDLPERVSSYFSEIRTPDYSFLLVSDDAVRQQRVLEREKLSGVINKADHALDIIDVAGLRFMRMFELTHVDTNERTPDEVCKTIINFIEGVK